MHGISSSVLFRACRNSYTLVLHKYGNMLYDGVRECVEERLKGIAHTVSQASDEALIETIVKEWNLHKIIMTMIRDILMYMVRLSCGNASIIHPLFALQDKTYCKQNKLPPVYEMGLHLFRDSVIRK